MEKITCPKCKRPVYAAKPVPTYTKPLGQIRYFDKSTEQLGKVVFTDAGYYRNVPEKDKVKRRKIIKMGKGSVLPDLYIVHKC